MPKKLDSLVGQVFNRLTVLEEDLPQKRPRKWICKCSCGIVKSIDQQALRNGSTQSCGCLNREIVTIHGDSKTRLFGIWQHMNQRCNNPKSHAYSEYGGRGITVCKEWADYSTFKKWSIENGYTDELSIDRIDNDMGYYPENCRWATKSTQQRNTRSHKKSSSIYKGVSFIQKDNSYQVAIYVEGKHYYLGRYKSEIEAAKTYNDFIINNNLDYYLLNKV